MVYGILEKTVKATIMMHSSIQAFASSPDGDTEYFNITDSIQKGDSRTPYLFAIIFYHALRTLDEYQLIGFTLNQSRNRTNLGENIADTDFGDDLVVHIWQNGRCRDSITQI